MDPREVQTLVPGPALVAPSPNQQPTTASSPRYFAAKAMPAAWGTCVAMGEEWLMIPSRREPQWLGICRPPEDGILGLGEEAEEDLVRGHPGKQDDSDVAVVRDPDVLSRPQGHPVPTWHPS